MGLAEIPWPGAATLMWDGDEVVDITSGQRGDFSGSLTSRLIDMTYRFDRAIGVRNGDVSWAVAYANRSTKALLIKNGAIHRELNRSFYYADSYDYPIAIWAYAPDRVVIIHCPNKFNLLEIEDAETGAALDSLNSKDMEFHSRLNISPDGKLVIDAGWFWHPWCGAAVFEVTQVACEPIRFGKNTIFSAQNEIDSVAFLGNAQLIVSSVPDFSGENSPRGGLGPKQLGVWSLTERRWERLIDLSEPTGMMMPWKEWVVSFYGHPKLIELATGKVVHRWDKIYSGKQVGPIEMGDPPPPAVATDPNRGRFAIADSKTVTLVSL